jgi:hypothetical protein
MLEPEMKTFIDVPYAEKDEAKSLGARWDPTAKSWFVPESMELEPFADWLPEGHEVLTEPGWPRVARRLNRRPHVLLLSRRCWKCDQVGYAVSVAVHVSDDDMPEYLPHCYSLATGRLDTGEPINCFYDCSGRLGMDEELSTQLAEFVASTPMLRGVATFKVRSSRSGHAYFSQGCPRCDSLWGDDPLGELHSERGAQILGQEYDGERVVFAFELRLR